VATLGDHHEGEFARAIGAIDDEDGPGEGVIGVDGCGGAGDFSLLAIVLTVVL